MMKKELGFVGLGRMGLAMTTRLVEQGYTVVGYDPTVSAQAAAAAVGVKVTPDISTLTATLGDAKVIWLMVPSSLVDTVLAELLPLLNSGDTVIDGGNSFYKDSVRRHDTLAEQGIVSLDVGTSGGVTGARHGASLMVGGSPEAFTAVEPLLRDLATRGGYARVGTAGAGHFVKMIHNGIEYGMMGAIAEGVAVLHDHKAQFGIDLPEVFKPYEHESIISSKLVSWLSEAFKQGQIENIKGEVPVGETEFEMEHITTLGEVLVLKAALAQRKQSREQASYLGKLVAAMRNQFGGHKVIDTM